MLSALRKLWNGSVHGDQHKLTIVHPEGMAEWFTKPYGDYRFFPGEGRGEMDAVPVWLGWPGAAWNRLDGPWKEWSSGQLSGCIIRHLRGEHKRDQGLACPLCEEPGS
jgi:hypothetical protein